MTGSRTLNASVAVIGSGAAGMMAALQAAEVTSVILITDRKLGRSNSLMAQGGLQVPPDSEDERKVMIADMLRSSRGLSNPERVTAFVHNIAPTIAFLHGLGIDFDRDDTGEYVRRFAGGLSRPRIVSSKDQIGPKVMTALRKAVTAVGFPFLEFCQVDNMSVVETDLGRKIRIGFKAVDDTGDARVVVGEQYEVMADAVVCATGGRSYAYSREIGEDTTNPVNANDRIYGVLKSLGLHEENVDLFQYQPFGIVRPEHARGRCVPETISNFSIDIVDREGKSVCNTHEDRLAMVSAMKEARSQGRAFLFDNGAWAFAMKLPSQDLDTIRKWFPKLSAILRDDIDVLYVRPILHYYLGGFDVNTDYSTSIDGLYLAGEITTGLHGANRLMGTGLLDSLVGGMAAGRNAADYAVRSKKVAL